MFTKLGAEIEAKKQTIIGTEIVAPNARNVVTPINGLKFHLTTVGAPTEAGVGRWLVGRDFLAHYVGPVARRELGQILNRLPRSPLVWLGDNVCHVFNLADSRFDTTLSVINPLEIEVGLFATVEVAFWGQLGILYRATGRNRKIAVTLQRAFTEHRRLGQIKDPLPEVYRSAYEHKYGEISPEALLAAATVQRGPNIRQHIATALQRGGARLVNLSEFSDRWVVEYQILEVSATRTFTATFSRDLQMLVPGLCFRTRQPVGITEFVTLVREGYRRGIGDWQQQWAS